MVFVVCRAAGVFCALPIEHVVETMRPLPVARVAGAPPFVRGVTVVRGRPVPVVDADALLTGDGRPSDRAPASRFVTVRAGDRTVALAVHEVVGVRELAAPGELPPLLGDGSAALAAIEAIDAELLVLLRAARLLPEAAWSAIDAAGGAA